MRDIKDSPTLDLMQCFVRLDVRVSHNTPDNPVPRVDAYRERAKAIKDELLRRGHWLPLTKIYKPQAV